MAHGIFLDYPNWNVAKQDNWVSVFEELDNEIPCTCFIHTFFLLQPLNTLFMHFFVAVDEYATGCLKEIIRTVFKAVPELYFIFLIVPTYVSLGSTLITVFDLVGNVPCLTYDEDFAVHICHRHDHYPQLHIRKARVEDHDDLMPIFLHYDNTLREIYGEYFLAELIEAQDEENHAVVCEVEGKAVGFMSVCSSVNLPLLHECFDLGPFHGFCVPHPDDLLEPSRESSLQESQDGLCRLPKVNGLYLVLSSDNQTFCITIDTETKSESQGSQKAVEDPGRNASSEALETQEKDEESSLFGDLLSGDISGHSDEVQDVEQKLSVLSNVGYEDLTLSSESSLPSFLFPEESSHFRPIYLGESTAFCIQLFCIDEKYEARQLRFPAKVSRGLVDSVLIPEPMMVTESVRAQSVTLCPILNLEQETSQNGKNFCLISVPHLTPEFVLIQNFVKVVPFNNCTLEHDLYVFHRAGLLRSIKIRLASFVDTTGVENLVSTLVLSRQILDDFSQYIEACRDPDGTALQVFVAEVANQIVGIAVIRKEMIQNSYAHSLTSALHYLVPVRPRRQIVYPLEKLGINAPSKEVSKDQHHLEANTMGRFFVLAVYGHGLSVRVHCALKKVTAAIILWLLFAELWLKALYELSYVTVTSALTVVTLFPTEGLSTTMATIYQPSYALNHTNRKLTLEPKVTVNARIVVVGASSVGISFLETLVFCHCFSDKDYALMSLCSWVNVVVGRMTGIDRAAKHVVVSKNEIVFYDHLILCTGQQYQVPCPTGADIDKHLTSREVVEKRELRYTGKVPHNLFILNDEEDCVKALIWMRSNSILTEGKVIVYGNTIDAYTAVETLLHIGMKGACIYFVHPPADSNITCFNNYVIESALQDALTAAGVAVYKDSLLAQWNDGQDPDPIHSASFTTSTKPFRLECSVFFSFYKKNVDYETFKALNDACLVYDGRLVIDTTFHTNDIAIRAAGSLTKFSNRYYSNEWTHSNFSSKEIGFQLAAAMLSLFDPTLEPMTEPPADLDRLIPMYKGAKIQGGILPGSYHYLHIAKPTIPSPLDVQRSQPDFGSEIITGNAKDGTYFRLYMSKYKLVEAITCLSKEPFPVSNYIRLFGQHEQVLNNLCIRFDDKLIPDLYSSSRESHSKTAAFPPCSSIRHTENTFLHAGGTDDIQGSVFLQAEDQEGSSPTSEMPSGALWEHRVTAEQSARMLRSQQLPLDHSSGGSAAQVTLRYNGFCIRSFNLLTS
ncbi:hypothetical protein ACRRTK_013561 [Alexandromys fortis]